MAKDSKAKKQARPADRKPKKLASAGKGIEKRKHAHAEAAASPGKEGVARKHLLLQKLEAGAPKATVSAREKKRAKRSAQAAVLGAVGGMAASLEELMAASDARVRGSASTHAQDGGVSLTSKKRCTRAILRDASATGTQL
eukprot:3754535-Prymnesium_polylepis.1